MTIFNAVERSKIAMNTNSNDSPYSGHFHLEQTLLITLQVLETIAEILLPMLQILRLFTVQQLLLHRSSDAIREIFGCLFWSQ